MKTFRGLDVYPRILLIVMLVMLMVFSVAYPLTISRMGFQYRGEILVPQIQENQTVYSGRVNGQKASFTVTSDGTITCQMGDKAYGPYTFREDPAALPSNAGAGVQARGVELYEGEKLMFRGGVEDMDGQRWAYDGNGNMNIISIRTYATTPNGFSLDANGNPVDAMEPSVEEILYLATGPEWKHNGSWSGWLEGASVCALVAATVFFADDMFYLRMSVRVRDAESVEPSSWELLSRRIGWTVGLLLAFLLFWNGIQS